MNSSTADDVVRNRLDKLAAALRAFGVVDRFELGPLFQGRSLPSRSAVVARLRRNADALPPAVSADYLGRCIVEEVGRDEAGNRQHRAAPITNADSALLNDIPSGRKHASRYQRHVRRLIGGLFTGLVDAGSEVKQYRGRSRIDLVFRNAANTGFFADIVRLIRIRGMFIPVECKNCSDDPENPEFQQLLHRLDPKLGTFGILACRTASDRDAALDRSAPLAARGSWIAVISDVEFHAMIRDFVIGDMGGVEASLYEQVRRIALE